MRWLLQVFLFPLSCLGVLVLQDEVDLVCATAPVWPKHDDVLLIVIEILSLRTLAVKKLDVGATTLKPVLELCFKLHDEWHILSSLEGRDRGRDSVGLCLLWHE